MDDAIRIAIQQGIDRHSSLGASAAAEVPTNPGGACGSVRSLKAIPPSCVRHNHFKYPVPPLLEKDPLN